MPTFAIMNNTPFHFIIAGLELATFLGAVFVRDTRTKERLVLAMKVIFGLVLLTGLGVWLIAPITVPLVVKSLGGLVLFWTMLQIVRDPSKSAYWILFAAIAVVGLTLAFFYI
jgi:hypothetical protein